MTIAKELKAEIMDAVLKGIFTPLQKNSDKLTNHHDVLDILYSVLVMTNREVLTRIIYGSNSQIHTKRILKDFFNAIDSELKKRLSELAQQGKH